jgi:hypothetical protein
MKVIIIGGGICGLYLAYLLKNINIDFEIHEKSSRPGGRIKSINIFNKNLECGAQLIQPYHFNTIALLNKLKINTNIIDSKKIFGSIEEIDKDVFDMLLEKISLSYKKDKPENMSAIDYISSIFSLRELNLFKAHIFSDSDLNNEISDFMKYTFYDLKLNNQTKCIIPSLHKVYESKSESINVKLEPNCSNNKYITVQGGLQVLTDKLALLVQEKLYLSSPVTSITYMPITNSYIIEANKRLINADYLVLATDASIKKIRLSVPKEIKYNISYVKPISVLRLYTLHSDTINIGKSIIGDLTQTQNILTNIEKIESNIIGSLCIGNSETESDSNNTTNFLYNLLTGKDKSISNKEIKKILHKILQNIIGQELPPIQSFVACKWNYGSHYSKKQIKTNFWSKYNLLLAGEWVHPYHNTIEGSVISALESFTIITKNLFEDKLKHKPDVIKSIESNRTKYIDYPVKTY